MNLVPSTNKDLEALGYVKTEGYVCPEWFRKWCDRQRVIERMVNSSIAVNRTHKWFGYEVILTRPFQIYKAHQDECVNWLGDCFFPDWHCAMLCHYLPGGHMREHCDHSGFELRTVLVNSGAATLQFEIPELGRWLSHHLEDGQVITFKSDIRHRLCPVTSDRWSLTFRRIKPEYLPS